MIDQDDIKRDDPQPCWDDMTELDDPEEDTDVAD